MSGSSADPLRGVRGYLHTNPYALGRQTSDDFDYNVAQSTPRYPWSEMAAFAAPGLTGENGYLDSPAQSGTGRTGHGDGSLYQLPQRGDPSYQVHQTDGSGGQENMAFSGTDVTSAQRVEAIPLYDRRPGPVPSAPAQSSPGMTPPDKWWNGQGFGGVPGKDRSALGGEDLEEINRPMNPYPYTQGQRRWMDTPRREPVDAPRPRLHQSPDGWRFMRPFDQFNRPYEDDIAGTSRRFTGIHFSMADHRRTYDVLGMRPAKSYRNTYRIEPAPWDEANTDAVPMYAEPSRLAQYDVYGSSRSYRLG